MNKKIPFLIALIAILFLVGIVIVLVLNMQERETEIIDPVSGEEEVKECFISGCSGEICSDELWDTTCEFLPGMECLEEETSCELVNNECTWVLSQSAAECFLNVIEEQGEGVTETRVGNLFEKAKEKIKSVEPTKDIWTCGDVINYGGDIYKTILIGEQCWLRENLKITDNNTDQQSCSITRYCYDDDPNNCDIYGGIYKWYDIMCYERVEPGPLPEGVQGICPDGWYIPTDADWTILTDYLGEPDIGSKMAGGYDLWEDGDLRNSKYFGKSGLDILPGIHGGISGDYRCNYSDFDLGLTIYLWSSTETATGAFVRFLNHDSTNVYFFNHGGKYGSVRCLMEEREPEITDLVSGEKEIIDKNLVFDSYGFFLNIPNNWEVTIKEEDTFNNAYGRFSFSFFPPEYSTNLWGGFNLSVYNFHSNIDKWIESYLSDYKDELIIEKIESIGGNQTFKIIHKDEEAMWIPRFVILGNEYSYVYGFFQDGKEGFVERIKKEIFPNILIKSIFETRNWEIYANKSLGVTFLTEKIELEDNSSVFIRKRVNFEKENIFDHYVFFQKFLEENNEKIYDGRLLLETLTKVRDDNIKIFSIDYIGKHSSFSRLYFFLNFEKDIIEIWFNTNKTAFVFDYQKNEELLKSFENYEDFKNILFNIEFL